MKNRGEITTQQLVTMIILIASFAIILFFLMRLGLGETTDKEICHNSVITRGSAVVPTDAMPLKCKREYVCITADKTCEQMTKPTKKKVQGKEDVYEVLAEEMVNCWWMFGQGEINYVGSDVLKESYCSICSQIAFDDSVDFFENHKINEEELYDYLANSNVSGKKETYLEYLYGTKDISNIKDKLVEQNVEFGFIDITNQQYVMMGIKSDVSKVTWIVGGTIVGAIALVLSPVATGIISGALFASGGATGGNFIATLVQGGSGNEYLSPTIIEVNSE